MPRVLLMTGGHRVDHVALLDMVGTLAEQHGWRWAHAVQPSAQQWLQPGTPWDVLLLHDLPGLYLRRGEPPAARGPSTQVSTALRELLAQGIGIVATHHALAGWPAWDDWADALGGRFLYAPGTLHGAPWPSSGTRLATCTARPVAPQHPVCAGVEAFALDDELYCCPVLADVVPLVRHDADVDPRGFVSAYEHVLHGPSAAPDCRGHPPASDLLAWATASGASPVVYVQPGDNAATFAVPAYRRVIGNAINWVASADARSWALARLGDGRA